MKSQTILPMPQGLSTVFNAVQNFTDSEEIDFTLKSSLENAIMNWSTLCNDVLHQSFTEDFSNIVNANPRDEYEFWRGRQKNLESIYDQLRDPRVKKIGEYLELTNSTYTSTFRKLFQNVVAALVEARDICLYLKTLLPHVKNFEDYEFLECEPYVKPMLHTIALIWTCSKYYSSSDKIVNLMRMLANLIIDSAAKTLDPGNIFQGDPEEIHEKLHHTIDIINYFQDVFEYVRSNLNTFDETRHRLFPDETFGPIKPWNFHRRTVFQKLLDFVDRLKLLETILGTQLEFSKLEKVEIGGLKGRLLSQKCETIFDEFNKAFNMFNNIQYEVLDLNDDNIVKDSDVFNEKCADFDRRLAAIFAQAFDECHNLKSIFKFLDIVGNLISRKVINDELKGKCVVFLQLPILVRLFNFFS